MCYNYRIFMLLKNFVPQNTIMTKVYEILINEKIIKNRLPDVINHFIKELTDNTPIKAITTDLYPMYRNIFENLNIKQQSCIIQLRRTIYTKLKMI